MPQVDRTRARPFGGALVATAFALAAAGCGRAGTMISGACPEAANATVVVERSPQSASAEITAETLDAVAVIADGVSATCGSLALAVDRGGGITPVSLFEGGKLRPPGGDDQGRSVFRPVMVEAVVTRLRDELAVPVPTGTGSDPLNSLEWAARHAKPRSLVVVISDGLATTPTDLNSAALLDDPAVAATFVGAFPKLSGLRVLFSGIGRTADAVPTPRAVRAALFDLYRKGCQAAGAESCEVVDTMPGAAGKAREAAAASLAARAKHPDLAGLPPLVEVAR